MADGWTRRPLYLGVVVVVLLAAAGGALALGESLGVKAGVIVPGRRAVNVTGTVACTAGQSGRLTVTVTQKMLRATGGTHLVCRGRGAAWRVRVRTARGMRLSPGTAGVEVRIMFAPHGGMQNGIGEAGSIRLSCPSSRRANGQVDDVPLRALRAGSQIGGTARISRHHHRWQISVAAQHVPPNGRADAYAVWLHSAPGDDRLLGFVNPGVGRDGRIQTAGELPADVGCYQEVLVSRETTATPRHPRTVVLAGPIRIG